MALDMEKRGKEDGLPYLLIIHCPDTGEWVRCSQSFAKNREACHAMAAVVGDYLNIIANK